MDNSGRKDGGREWETEGERGRGGRQKKRDREREEKERRGEREACQHFLSAVVFIFPFLHKLTWVGFLSLAIRVLTILTTMLDQQSESGTVVGI